MSVFANLSADDQALIDKKLEELSQKTGDVWTCEICAADPNCWWRLLPRNQSEWPEFAADLP